MAALKRIGVLAHPARPQTAPLAQAVADALRGSGCEVWLYTTWNEADVRADIDATDMVVAIGGDGAMLRSSRVCAPFAIPVLGINMGHLGFLTEISPEGWQPALEQVLAGSYWIEARMMLRVSAWRGDTCLTTGDALNDIVIERGISARTIRLDTYIDHTWTTTYSADGLIVATATGSTAYALASGGPILPPELRNILIVPVAAHLSLDRPMVLPEGVQVEVIVAADTHTATVLTSDGEQMLVMQAGDRVHIQASEHVSRFIRLRERGYFFRSLLDRLEPRIPVRLPPSHPDLSRPDDERLS